MKVTWKEFRRKFINKFFPTQEKLYFASRTLTWAGYEYFVCRAVIPDIKEIITIEKQVYAGKTPWSEQVFRRELSQRQHNLYLVVRYEDEMVAFAGIDLMRAPGRAHITNIAVLPSFQGRKIGNMLMELLLKEAYDLDCQTVTLEVATKNQVAQNLYRSLGFRVVKLQKNYYQVERQDAYLMEKELKRQGK